MSDTFSLAGETAVVTGSSSGIGEAIAREFAEAGASVVLSAPESERDRLEGLRDEIVDANHDGTATYAICDVTDRDAVEALGDETVAEFGSVDVLVNNAGGGIPTPIKDLTAERWESVVSLNLGGTFNCINLIGQHMLDDGGSIVNLASRAGIDGLPGMSPYGAAKAGIINLTKTVAHELSVYDIRVNALAPGTIATERIVDRSDGYHPSADEIDRDTVARRVGKPEEVAEIARVLASPAASYMTGVTVPVAGVPRNERTNDVRDVNEGESLFL